MQDVLSSVQPNLDNTIDSTHVTQIHTMRDKLQSVALEVGSKPGNLPSGCLRERVATLEAGGGGGGVSRFVDLTDGPGEIIDYHVPVGVVPESGSRHLVNIYFGFQQLGDGPGSFQGQEGKFIRVASGESYLEYADAGVGTLDRMLVFSDDTTLVEPGTGWVTKKSFRIVRDSAKPPTSWRIVTSLVASGQSEIAECRVLAVGSGGTDTSGAMSVTGTTEAVRAVTLAIVGSNEPVDTLIEIEVQLRKQGTGGTGVSLIYTDIYAVYAN
jgi:hypothetical protein